MKKFVNMLANLFEALGLRALAKSNTCNNSKAFSKDIYPKDMATEGLTSFLDKEKRVNAKIITESCVNFTLDSIKAKNRIEVKGQLGAVPSEARPGCYVGFSGIDIKTFLLNKNHDRVEFLKFKLEIVRQSFEALTVQVVSRDKKNYAKDLAISDTQEDFALALSDLRLSVRGKIGKETFAGETSDIDSVRFFLKRSLNSPKSTASLFFNFILSDVTL